MIDSSHENLVHLITPPLHLLSYFPLAEQVDFQADTGSWSANLLENQLVLHFPAGYRTNFDIPHPHSLLPASKTNSMLLLTKNIRAFSLNQKGEAYERQKGICPVCKEHYEIKEMEGDHITPWHEGGKTIPENCQMLCREDNRRKSGG